MNLQPKSLLFLETDKFDPEDGLILYGGRFDPWHKGHKGMLMWMCENLRGQIKILPTYDPEHKAIKSGLTFEERCQRIHSDIEKNDRVSISMLEKEEQINGRTGRALKKIRQEDATKRITVVIGFDEWESLDQWLEIESWFFEVDWIVLRRGSTAKTDPRVFTLSNWNMTEDERGILSSSANNFVLFAGNLLYAESGTAQRKKLQPVRKRNL